MHPKFDHGRLPFDSDGSERLHVNFRCWWPVQRTRLASSLISALSMITVGFAEYQETGLPMVALRSLAMQASMRSRESRFRPPVRRGEPIPVRGFHAERKRFLRILLALRVQLFEEEAGLDIAVVLVLVRCPYSRNGPRISW